MEKSYRIQNLIKEIEWMPSIEVIVYAALNIKRCSYFFHSEKLKEICEENYYDIQKFYSIIQQLGLCIEKDFFISVFGWSDYDVFYKKHRIEESCRIDNVEGLFLDIPKCCAKIYATQGNLRDREILRLYPFRGASTPEQIYSMYPVNEQEKARWLKGLFQHFVDHGKEVLDYSKETQLQVEKLIEQKKLPEEIILLFSTYTPCKVNCKEFIDMAQKMNESLVCYLSPERYNEIINGYKGGMLCL